MNPNSNENPIVPVIIEKKKESFFGEIVKFTIIALAIVVPIRLFIARPFLVSGASMDPTFETNDYLIINELTYRFELPKRGEVIIFKPPQDSSKYYIKRIIGLPGEVVVLDGTSVIIRNKDYPDGFKLNEPYVTIRNEKEESMTVTLADGEYFVMGDNRRQSSDSRSWGPVPDANIIGKPFIRLFPFGKIDISPGYYKELR